jgi:hypothetical protein
LMRNDVGLCKMTEVWCYWRFDFTNGWTFCGGSTCGKLIDLDCCERIQPHFRAETRKVKHWHSVHMKVFRIDFYFDRQSIENRRKTNCRNFVLGIFEKIHEQQWWGTSWRVTS